MLRQTIASLPPRKIEALRMVAQRQIGHGIARQALVRRLGQSGRQAIHVQQYGAPGDAGRLRLAHEVTQAAVGLVFRRVHAATAASMPRAVGTWPERSSKP